jgi:hypothetical protein
MHDYWDPLVKGLFLLSLKGFSFVEGEEDSSSVEHAAGESSLLAGLIPLNNGTIVPLDIPPPVLESFFAVNLSRYSVKNGLTDFLIPHAKSAAKSLFGSNFSHGTCRFLRDRPMLTMLHFF